MVLAAAAAPGLARAPFTAADLWRWHDVSGAQIAADGDSVVYIERRCEDTEQACYSTLWFTDIAGTKRTAVTTGKRHDRQPQISPDGQRLAWLGESGGQSTALLVRGVYAATEIQVATAGLLPEHIAWSPDGTRLAFLAESASPPPAWATGSIAPFLRSGPARTRRLYLTGPGFQEPRPLGEGGLDDGGPPAWSPDGSALLVARQGQIWRVDAQSGAATDRPRGGGAKREPAWSPDGRRICYLVAEDTGGAYTAHKAASMDADGSRQRVLSGALDRDARLPRWSSDSRTVYFLAEDAGTTGVWAARADGTLRRVRRPVERLDGFSLADNGRAVSVQSTPRSGPSVVAFAVDTPSETAVIADPNATLLAERDFNAAEEIRAGSGDTAVQSWLIRPPGFDPARRYPMLALVSDGPRAMQGAEFELHAQVLAASGWMVLRVNPRGTTGYGEAFGNLLPTANPDAAFDSTLLAVNAAVEKAGADPARLVLEGGPVAAWALGHTQRFRTAILRQPVADWTLEVALRGAAVRRELGAWPWEAPDLYRARSPILAAPAFSIPVLLLAAPGDPQSELLRLALTARGVEAALMTLPAGGGPRQAVLELEAELAWLARFAR